MTRAEELIERRDRAARLAVKHRGDENLKRFFTNAAEELNRRLQNMTLEQCSETV